VVEFILNTRELLRHAIDVATEHAANERTKAKLWYDRHACERDFEPGEKILFFFLFKVNRWKQSSMDHIWFTSAQVQLTTSSAPLVGVKRSVYAT